MKRRIAVLLLAVLLLACVPTPETEYVVNKSDQNTMIESSRNEEAFGNADLRTMYHIPERMTGRYSSADGAVEVTVTPISSFRKVRCRSCAYMLPSLNSRP